MVEAKGKEIADGEADDPVADDLHDEAGVVVFPETENDFGRVERGRVRLGGFGEAERAAGVEILRGRQVVGIAAQTGDCDAGPFAPEVDAGGEIDDVRDEGAAVAALSQLDRLSSAAIRARFEQRFTARRMAQDYLALYRRLAVKSRPALRVVT